MFVLLQLPVSNFLNKGDYLLLSSDLTFENLLESFKRESKNFAIFVRDNKPIGIITERDLIRALSQGYPRDAPVMNLAKKELVKIKKNASLLYAFNLMTENFIRRLIVVDDRGYFEGVITQQDLLKYSSEEIFKGEGKIRDLLEIKGSLVYAFEDETLESALEKLTKYNIGVLPILDSDYRPVGIISERDFIKFQFKDLKLKLKEIASKEVITIRANQSIVEAVRIFKSNPIRHLIVVDNHGRALNVISQRDLIQSLTCSYAEFLENQLKQAKNFISLLPEIVFEFSECDTACKVSWMNDFAKKNFGEECLDKEVYELFDYDDWNRIYGIAKREGTIVNEFLRSLDGKKVYIVTGQYITFGREEGKIKLFLRDITSELSKEESYKREIRFLKSFLHNSLDYIIVIDPSGKIHFANQSFLKALGYTEEEILNKTFHDILAQPREVTDRNIEIVAKKGQELRGIRYYRDIHHQLIPVESRAKAITLNGQTFIIINARDIRETLEKEQTLKRNLEFYKNFYDFVSGLNYVQKEEDLFHILERFLLKSVKSIHYYLIDQITEEVQLTYVAGDKSCWEDCLEGEIKNCGVYKTGRVFIGSDASPCPLFKKTGLFYLCLPLFFEGRLQGILNLLKSEPFSEEERLYLEEIVNTFNIYLNQLKLLNKYEELSTKDPLLGVYNRRFLMEVIKKEIERAKRLGTSFSVILMDLDHFKSINDTLGHFIGDEVLKAFSNLVLTHVRSMDIFGRLGGEEFLLILPETKRNEAVKIADRIRTDLEATELLKDKNLTIRITVSLGVAGFPEDGISVESILKVADQRLYQAKSLGRNRTVAQ